MENFLSVKTKEVEFTVSGDTDFVEDAYKAVRNLILERFVDATNTPPIPAQPVPTQKADASEEVKHISFITCNEVYRKIHFVTSKELNQTPFALAIDFDGIQRVYIDRELQPTFEKHFPLGKALWRELTTAGRSAIRNAN